MTECDAVRRAGTPSNVNIGVGDGNDRRVVLTYLDGTWPGIYTFHVRPTEGNQRRAGAAEVGETPHRKRRPRRRRSRERLRRRRYRCDSTIRSSKRYAVSSALEAASQASSALAIAGDDVGARLR